MQGEQAVKHISSCRQWKSGAMQSKPGQITLGSYLNFILNKQQPTLATHRNVRGFMGQHYKIPVMSLPGRNLWFIGRSVELAKIKENFFLKETL